MCTHIMDIHFVNIPAILFLGEINSFTDFFGFGKLGTNTNTPSPIPYIPLTPNSMESSTSPRTNTGNGFDCFQVSFFLRNFFT